MTLPVTNQSTPPAPIVEFRDPPEPRRGRPGKWDIIANTLKARPGEWAYIGQGATTIASNIRTGRHKAMPQGEFEAASRSTGVRGWSDIYIRYVGSTASRDQSPTQIRPTPLRPSLKALDDAIASLAPGDLDTITAVVGALSQISDRLDVLAKRIDGIDKKGATA